MVYIVWNYNKIEGEDIYIFFCVNDTKLSHWNLATKNTNTRYRILGVAIKIMIFVKNMKFLSYVSVIN